MNLNEQKRVLLFSSRVMASEFTDIVSGHRENQRLSGILHEVDKHSMGKKSGYFV